jgi:phosphotriesterase-related protein
LKYVEVEDNFMKNNIGMVQTVNGVISPSELGITLMHEHILVDTGIFFEEPEDEADKIKAHKPITMDNLQFVRYNPTKNVDNCKFEREDMMAYEVGRFKETGGGTIAELSTIGVHIGVNGNPEGMKRISSSTGVHIVKGTGLYIGASLPPETAGKSIDLPMHQTSL